MRKTNLFFIFFVVLNFFSCNSDRNKSSNVFNMYLSIDGMCIDPRVAGNVIPQILIGALYEGLMRLDPQGNIEPGVAEKYEMAEDYLSCTFYLRQTVWSNGESLTAHDFVNAWREALSPTFDTNHAYAFYPIKNAEAARLGKVTLDKIGLKALNDRTLFVEFEYPAPFFIELATNPFYSPVYLHKSSTELISNGPFILKEWKKCDYMLMEKNKNYWDAEAVKIDGISTFFITDSNTAFMLYEAGKLDIFGNPFSDIPLELALYMEKEEMLREFPANRVSWLLFNTEKPPFNSKKIRKAFSYAINRDKIVNQLLQRGDKPSTSILPEFLHLQEEPYFTDGNIEEARRLFKEGLQELGMTKETMPKIELLFTPRCNEKIIVQAIQDQWREALDVIVDLHMTERSIYAAGTTATEFQIATGCWVSWISDPSYNLGHVKTKNRLNVSHWENPQYQELISLAEKETNIHRRREFYHQAEMILMDEMPIAPIFSWNCKYVLQKGVEGICFTRDGRPDFRNITKNDLLANQ